MCEHDWNYIHEEIYDADGKYVGNYTMPTKRECKNCGLIQTRAVTWMDVKED